MRLPHHFITCINVDLTSAVVSFPSLSGLVTLFPHYCIFSSFSNRQLTFFCHWPAAFPSKGTSVEQLYYILLATVYSFICMLFLRLHLTFRNMIQTYLIKPESFPSQALPEGKQQCYLFFATFLTCPTHFSIWLFVTFRSFLLL